VKNRMAFLIVAALLAAPTTYGADACVGLKKALNQAEKTVSENIMGSLKLLFNVTVEEDCGSLATVLDRVSNRKRTGGRRLEEDKPLDVAAAQADLEAAMKNEEIRARVEKARATLGDETATMLYQATILDSEGHYAARDLIVSQLIERAK
jgi:hypothetical protein